MLFTLVLALSASALVLKGPRRILKAVRPFTALMFTKTGRPYIFSADSTSLSTLASSAKVLICRP